MQKIRKIYRAVSEKSALPTNQPITKKKKKKKKKNQNFSLELILRLTDILQVFAVRL